nr:hypothetical protein [Actinomycetota bacterium]
ELPTLSLSATDAGRLARIEDELHKLSRQPKPTTVGPDIDGTAQELMASLGSQIEALRRRMAVRGRPQASALDPETLEAIAEAVAARLADPTATSLTKSRAKRAPPRKATAQKATAQKATSANRKSGS